jgi:hypothetical protein
MMQVMKDIGGIEIPESLAQLASSTEKPAPPATSPPVAPSSPPPPPGVD